MVQTARKRGAEVGSGFQEALNRTNEAYEKAGIACITRKAIPGKYIMPKETKRRGLTLPNVEALAGFQTGARVRSDDLQSLLKTNRSDPRAFVPESRGEPDYGGCLAPQGRAIYYDAKSTKREQLDFDNLHPHQVAYLERTAAVGAVAGFLVEFAAHNRVYFLPIQVLVRFRAITTRKSIPYRFFEAHLIPVKPGKGLLIHDYLQAIREQETKYGTDFAGLPMNAVS